MLRMKFKILLSMYVKEPQRDRSKMNLVLPIAVGGVAILVVGFLIVAFAILRKRYVLFRYLEMLMVCCCITC